jgi:hypothetical protein
MSKRIKTPADVCGASEVVHDLRDADDACGSSHWRVVISVTMKNVASAIKT